MPIQKFYLHDAATGNTGTFPSTGTSQSVNSTPSVVATGAGTNRSMDGTPGTLQVGGAGTSLATSGTPQSMFLRRFVSPPLAATGGAPTTGTWTFSFALSESNTNSNFQMTTGCIYRWIPGSGTLQQFLWDTNSSGGAALGSVATASEAASSGTISVGFDQAFSAGDVLIFEVWGWHGGTGQSMATAYTNTVFYDGTTDASATSNAAYLLAPAAIALASDPLPAPPNVTMARTRT